jgi:hypothetical protein
VLFTNPYYLSQLTTAIRLGLIILDFSNFFQKNSNQDDYIIQLLFLSRPSFTARSDDGCSIIFRVGDLIGPFSGKDLVRAVPRHSCGWILAKIIINPASLKAVVEMESQLQQQKSIP